MNTLGVDYPCTERKRPRIDVTSSIASSSESQVSMSQRKAKNNTAPEWIADVLQSNQIIVSRIFDYLDACSLSAAAGVCQFWRICAQENRRHRPKIFNFSSVRVKKRGEGPFDKMRCGRDLVTNLSECYSHPDVVMVFATKKLVDNGAAFFEGFSATQSELKSNIDHLREAKRSVYSTPLPNHISKYLPPGSLLQLCSAWGIVTTDIDRGPIEYERCEGFAALCFSKFPNVKVRPFSVREPKHIDRGITEPPPGCDILNAAGLGDLTDAKAVIAFSREEPEDVNSHASFLVDSLFERFPKLALAGAQVFSHSVLAPFGSGPGDAELVKKVSEPPDEEVSLGGVVIEGDVEAASIVMGPDVVGFDAVREQMLALKHFPVLPDRTIGFMFSCCGRGLYHHGDENVEASAFGSLYPGIPLLGVFGNGEFGVNSLHTSNTRNSMHNFKHSYSTAIMLITFGASSLGLPNDRDFETRSTSS